MTSAGQPSGLVNTVAPGSAIITATLGAKSGSTILTVTSATLVSIDLTPAIPVIASGTNQQFVATGTFSDDTIEDLTASATWTSSKTAVASVEQHRVGRRRNSRDYYYLSRIWRHLGQHRSYRDLGNA